MPQAAAGLATIALAVFVWFQARSFPTLPEGHPGPGLFPSIIAVALFVAGALLVLSARKRRSPAADFPHVPGQPEERAPLADPAQVETPDPTPRLAAARPGILRIVLVVGVVALYPVVAPAIGFVASLSVVSVVVALLLRARPVPATVAAVGGSILIYLLFTRLLGVPL